MQDEEGGKDQRAQHLKRRDPLGGISIEESPRALLWFDLKLEQPDSTLVRGFNVRDPSTNPRVTLCNRFCGTSLTRTPPV